MKTFEFTETTWDLVNNQRVKLADWTVATAGNNAIIIQKITPTTKSGDSIKKVVKVDDCDGYVFQVLKTKIKAIGAADGLVDWMNWCKEENLMTCRAMQVLNYVWDKIKPMKAN